MRSIGEMARNSGLGVSALRFYDGAGVFCPARVDPHTGYRWYAPEQLADARLLARLRRVGMPLADIGRVLRGDRAEADRALDGHLRRLEHGLADARRELATVRALLDLRENPMTPRTRLTVAADRLAAALDAVRFAAGSDPAYPAVAGVLLDAEGDTLRVVATDRYRLAVSAAPADLDGPAVGAVAPTAFVDALRPLLTGTGPVELTVDGDRLTAVTASGELSGTRIDQDYPDYRALVRLEPTHRLTVGADGLAALLTDAGAAVRTQDGVEYPVSLLAVGPETALTDPARGGLTVRLNHRFLLEAFAANPADQLVLELGGPIAPLALRHPDHPDTFSLLMPTAP